MNHLLRTTGLSVVFLFTAVLLSAYDVPKGWYCAGMTPDKYEMGIDPKSGQNGENTCTIRSKSKKVNGWGTLMQDFLPGKYSGKRIKMTARMKSEALTGKAGFWLRVDGTDYKKPLSFDNMMNRPVRGTTEWNSYEIILNVPKEATNIAFGALLEGGGQIWFGDFKFELLESDSPLKNTGATVNPEPALDFTK